MGAADAVPGVSGGTMALVLGIYEQLLDAITSVTPANAGLLVRGRLQEFSSNVPWRFVLTLFVGIAVAVVSAARVLEQVLENNPELLFGFFFGLVAASVWVVGRKLRWDATAIALGIAGTAIGAVIVSLSPADGSSDSLSLFVAGAVAICAMILPGISGAFILLLLGQYGTVLGAVNDRDLGIIAIVGAGAVIGLLVFARVLRRLLARAHDQTLALLVGFMAGSLLKLWPWRICVETVEDRCLQEQLQAAGDNWVPVLLLGLLGVAIVVVFDRLERARQARSVEPVDDPKAT